MDRRQVAALPAAASSVFRVASGARGKRTWWVFRRTAHGEMNTLCDSRGNALRWGSHEAAACAAGASNETEPELYLAPWQQS